MKGFRPLRRAGVLLVPLLLGGCLRDVIPGPGATDPSCVLLCALGRVMAGEPAPAPAVVAVPAGGPGKGPGPVRHAATPKHHPARVVAHTGPPARRRAPVEATVVPESHAMAVPPAQGIGSPPAPAPLPVPPTPASLPPAEPVRSFSQAIPGSVVVVEPDWQVR